jgi:hypothetical protein
MTAELLNNSQPYPAEAHLGFERFRHRGEHDSAERSIQAAWIDMNSRNGSTCEALDGILGEFSTERDARVAGTVMQWLGSSVGMAWLRQTFMDAGGDVVYPPVVRPTNR